MPDLCNKRIKRGARKLDPEKLVAYVRENPDLRIEKYAAFFDVSYNTIYENLKN